MEDVLTAAPGEDDGEPDAAAGEHLAPGQGAGQEAKPPVPCRSAGMPCVVVRQWVWSAVCHQTAVPVTLAVATITTRV
jgi:hypothetical protein